MVGFRIPLAGFRIPKPWIPDSTDQNNQDSGFRITLHGAIKVTVIEKVKSQNQEIRKAKENYWILRLNPTINKLTT